MSPFGWGGDTVSGWPNAYRGTVTSQTIVRTGLLRLFAKGQDFMGDIIDFRRGMSFDAAYELTVTIADVAISDLTGFTGEAKLKPENDVAINLTFAWINAAARLATVTSGSTAAWPLGGAAVEVQLTAPSGAKIDVQPFTLKILKGFADD